MRPAGRYVEWEVLSQRLATRLSKFPEATALDQRRRAISDACMRSAEKGKGIFTLTVPTGGGKTLASLRFALEHARLHGLDRIVYVVPFTSIIDQNAKVARDILEPADDMTNRGRIVLEHHSNLVPEVETAYQKLVAQDWDAPVVYTTMVQFLETLFGAGTRGVRRMHRLSNAVLIFDEVQSLPLRCVHLFNNAVGFLIEHCNSTAVLCTATQPLLDKVDTRKGAMRLHPDSELVPDVPELFDALRRVQVIDRRRPDGWSEAAIADLGLGCLGDEGSTLVIVNTKRAAKRVFAALLESKAEHQHVFHLSTDMCPAHRRSVLGKVRKRLAEDRPVICISTQLIEAGVDISFPVVIRVLAGLDSIAQAAGRCNRNRERPIGNVYVVCLLYTSPSPRD